MKKSIIIFFGSLFLCLMITGCGGPSEEKIAKVQEVYAQLVQVHNQVVEAHKGIDDSSLDGQLVALSEKVAEIETMNLSEMDEETIDSLIETIYSFIASYEEHLQTISGIKESEEQAVLIPISFSLTNETGQVIQKLVLYEENDLTTQVNVLEDATSFEPGESLVGLMVYRDASDTPWVMELENGEGASYEIELPVKDFDEEGEDLTLTLDPETQEMICS